ncbi:hypothetical protein Tco_1209121, partial [Tanacetum coccineum]
IRDTPGISVSKKKAPATTDRSKGIDFLSEAALFEEVQVKNVLKMSQRETTIHQAGGSGDGAGFQPEVLDEPKGKSVDTHKGIGLKPGVPDQDDEEDALESDDDLQQVNDEQTDLKNQKTNDEDEESEDAFVHTLEDYVPTDDEMNDVDEEEYEQINEE